MNDAAASGGDRRRHSETLFLVQQFAVNFLVAVVLTLVATTLVFHGRTAVPLWGMGNLAIDLIPSTVLPTLGATLAITKVTGLAIGRGSIASTGSRFYALLPKHDALAGLVIGLGLLVPLGAAFIGAISLIYDRQPVPYTDIVICKLLYALCVCVANTPLILARAKGRGSVSEG